MKRIYGIYLIWFCIINFKIHGIFNFKKYNIQQTNHSIN